MFLFIYDCGIAVQVANKYLAKIRSVPMIHTKDCNFGISISVRVVGDSMRVDEGRTGLESSTGIDGDKIKARARYSLY